MFNNANYNSVFNRDIITFLTSNSPWNNLFDTNRLLIQNVFLILVFQIMKSRLRTLEFKTFKFIKVVQKFNKP